MSRGRKPAVGDRVLVMDYWTETELPGVVDLLLSEQFRWKSDDNRIYLTAYNGTWILDKGDDNGS